MHARSEADRSSPDLSDQVADLVEVNLTLSKGKPDGPNNPFRCVGGIDSLPPVTLGANQIARLDRLTEFRRRGRGVARDLKQVTRVASASQAFPPVFTSTTISRPSSRRTWSIVPSMTMSRPVGSSSAGGSTSLTGRSTAMISAV